MPPKPPRIRSLWPSSICWSCRSSQFRARNQIFVQIRGIRSIQKPSTILGRYNKGGSLPTLEASQEAAFQRRIASDTLPLRSGAIAFKKGMSAMYDPATSKRAPVTILQVDRLQVVAHKTKDIHGYYAVVVGSGWKHPTKVAKPMLGLFANTKYENEDGETVGLSPKRDVREFRVRDEKGLLPIGDSITAAWFQEGQLVDTKSKNKGKGFAGVMKRWGMHGQPASHGVSKTHRSLGSAGPSQGSGSRVHPGKKMAGRMGGVNHTVQNLQVMQVDEVNGIVVVKGCVSGPKGCLVKIQDSLKKPWPEVPDNPATSAIRDKYVATAEEREVESHRKFDRYALSVGHKNTIREKALGVSHPSYERVKEQLEAGRGFGLAGHSRHFKRKAKQGVLLDSTIAAAPQQATEVQ